MIQRKKTIGLLTGGGDCPGINAVIRAVAKAALMEHGWNVVGIKDGYEGLIRGRWRRLRPADVSGILTLGGTILGTSNTADPYRYATLKSGQMVVRDVSRRLLGNARKIGLDALILIGGDGTLASAARLQNDGLPVVGVPKTIDNDLRGTDVTFGFDTAVSIATEAVDRLHSTAQSHHRVMIVEVMGRRAGWIALHAGVAGGGDIILMPEIPYRIEAVAAKILDRRRRGKAFSLVVVAEGARPLGGQVVVRKIVAGSAEPIRLGGIGFVLADELEKAARTETRAVVLGHVQRGGTPTAADRVLATRLGDQAVRLVAAGEFGRMVAVRGGAMTSVPLSVPGRGPRLVSLDHPLIAAARTIGTSFGDEG
ncbi:MAG: ATP-dependent 6-phosphofructokinase [Candidatus Aminicenantes bacterium]|nr:ATP-dependent 6-phosphofructokinase [Candidatus Aminicenantes bacterium]